ncbi:secreted RxLR effector protein 161-like [Daphnia magna]|uniref:secreted RxLR effector protein 161-like n=1 Tax=Daphnia magna TaxID=35525 RepID=UPI0014021712|nr:secreted RxLR effector protein 161-like [Daphnia magna]
MSPTSEEEKLDVSNIPYREAVGCLLYLSITCRPDISFAVSQVAKFCQNPGRPHWNAVKRILSYLAGTPNLGILFCVNSKQPLVGYTDADYGGDIDSRCSTSGFAFFVYGSLTSWSSRRQKCVSQSTTEAEYVAASETSKEAVRLKSLLT